MPPVSYTVTASLPDEPLTREYVDWLRAGHVDEVLRHGAVRAAIVRLTDPAPPPFRVETRYTFPDAASLAAYVSGPALALRQQGLERFPPQRGVAFERRTGQIIHVRP